MILIAPSRAILSLPALYRTVVHYIVQKMYFPFARDSVLIDATPSFTPKNVHDVLTGSFDMLAPSSHVMDTHPNSAVVCGVMTAGAFSSAA